MNTNGIPAATRDPKVVLSTLWIFVTLNYLYCELIGLMDPGLLTQYLRQPGPLADRPPATYRRMQRINLLLFAFIPGLASIAGAQEVRPMDVGFWAPERGEPTSACHEALTIGRRVADASAAIDFLVSQPWVDASRIVVVGHSEGAQVAPALAVANDRITHVAALAASGLSQAFDFVLDIRRRVRAGDLSFEEGEARIAALHDAIRRIEAAPESADSLWRGHSYQRWSSFFKAPLEAFFAIDVPVFVAVGVDDDASPVDSATGSARKAVATLQNPSRMTERCGAGHVFG